MDNVKELMNNIMGLYNLFLDNIDNEVELNRVLEIVMSNTNSSNYNWISGSRTFSKILDNKVFRNSFISNLDSIKYNGNDFILDRIINSLKYSNMGEDDIVLLIDKMINCDCLMYSSVVSLGDYICRKHPNMVNYMVNTFIKSKNTCDGIIRYISGNNSNIDNYFDYISDNIDIILNNYEYVNLIELNYITSIDKIVNKKVCNVLSKNEDICLRFFVKDILKKYVDDKFNKIDSNKFESICDIVCLIIKDILKNEHGNITDIEWITSGGFSDVIMICDKVLKIGNDRKTKSFPNNPYVNAMLLRREFEVGNNSSIFVEVNERVDTDIKVSEEELYQLYKKIRELGLIWTDVNVRNVGRLIHDNEINWREELPIDSDILGLDGYRGDTVLKKGDLVILDNDFIFDANSPDKSYKMSNNSMFLKFENRYLKEEKANRRRGNRKG